MNRRISSVTFLTSATTVLCATHARAQVVTFSIEYRGPTIGAPATGPGGPITAGDVLAPATPTMTPALGALPNPQIVIPAAPGGLGLAMWGACVGLAPGVACPIEVDALSYGLDEPIIPAPMAAGTYVYSVDRCSSGIPGAPFAPNVTSESPFGDAAADVFRDLGIGVAPLPPGGGGSKGWIDGNGMPSGAGFSYAGVGLVEPTMPGFAISGDELDAFDQDTVPGATGVPGAFFSLDAQMMNPCTNAALTGSAFAHGVRPGDVVFTPAAGGAPVVYAPAPALGLDAMGVGTDDLDALAILENGVAGWQRSLVPYDWIAGGGGGAPRDMLLFSVRRGSAVIGMADSLFGVPIEPGDVLTTPIGGAGTPAIFVAAEQLGLRTGRSFGFPPDELDALDTVKVLSAGTGFCFGDGSGAACPCGNIGAAGHGCANSIFANGGLLQAVGLPSVTRDSLTLVGSEMPSSTALYFQGTGTIAGGLGAVFGDGLRCIGGATVRLGVKTNDAAGGSRWPEMNAGDDSISVRGALPSAGGTRHYQVWYRNGAAFCTASTFNLTNGLTVSWTP